MLCARTKLLEMSRFTPIDIETWARKPFFDHYYNSVKCTYSFTVHVDITSLLGRVKLFPGLIYILTRAVNGIEELKVNYDREGKLGVWDDLYPSYTIFHADDKSFSSLWTPYQEDFALFHKGYLEDIKTYGDMKAFLPKGEDPPNAFPISCIPWLDFTAFNLNIYDDARYLFPIFTIGKYTQHEGKTTVPLSVQLHHAIADGYHAGLLVEAIKELAAKPDWLEK